MGLRTDQRESGTEGRAPRSRPVMFERVIGGMSSSRRQATTREPAQGRDQCHPAAGIKPGLSHHQRGRQVPHGASGGTCCVRGACQAVMPTPTIHFDCSNCIDQSACRASIARLNTSRAKHPAAISSSLPPRRRDSTSPAGRVVGRGVFFEGSTPLAVAGISPVLGT